MNQANHDSLPTDGQNLGKKSWTAYIRVGLIGFLLLLVVIPMMGQSSLAAGFVGFAIAIAAVVYMVMQIRSYRLYMDEIGVWVYSGVFPWQKGTAGVKWRDLDEAVYFQSMWSWLFKSYSLRIGHRFTKSSEILLSHWQHGHEVVGKINIRHQELVSSNALG